MLYKYLVEITVWLHVNADWYTFFHLSGLIKHFLAIFIHITWIMFWLFFSFPTNQNLNDSWLKLNPLRDLSNSKSSTLYCGIYLSILFYLMIEKWLFFRIKELTVLIGSNVVPSCQCFGFFICVFRRPIKINCMEKKTESFFSKKTSWDTKEKVIFVNNYMFGRCLLNVASGLSVEKTPKI